MYDAIEAAGGSARGHDLEARLKGHVEHLASRIGERNVCCTQALDAARLYIEDEWIAQGYAVKRQSYNVGGVRCTNLEVTRRGRKGEGGILLIGAHYDTVPGSPGANDNASGVAALLEISRFIAEVEPETTVRLVAFVNEEPPFFMTPMQGSWVYAHMARERDQPIRLMVALETIGFYSDAPDSQRYPPLFDLIYPRKANFIGFVSDLRSRRLMRRLVKTFRSCSDFPLEHAATFRFVPGASWSDHWCFWRHGYRAVMITDTAFYRYAHYHTARDTPEKLAYPAFARVTDGLSRCFARFE
ncbi:MAG: M28 family peptidase [Methyloligellaceae bacterium]